MTRARAPRGLENFIREIELNGSIANRTIGKTEKIQHNRNRRPAQRQSDIEKAMKAVFLRIENSNHLTDVVLQIPKIVDYMFAGHFHGGQIWMPCNLEFFLLRDDVLCKMGIRRGLKCINGIRVYINRGLGNVVVPFRFLSRPEILICTLP